MERPDAAGLVTLPGAFVGAIFGGASPLDAGRFRIVALAAIMAAASVTTVLLARALVPLERKPAPLRRRARSSDGPTRLIR